MKKKITFSKQRYFKLRKLLKEIEQTQIPVVQVNVWNAKIALNKTSKKDEIKNLKSILKIEENYLHEFLDLQKAIKSEIEAEVKKKHK